MSKEDKKKQKIVAKILELEQDMKTQLSKKSSKTAEISIADYQRKIEELRKRL